MRRILIVSLAAFLAAGCYHATVDTGLPSSGETVSKKWASSWIAGLVPPSTVETAAQCPNGVAQVDTQLSFANQLVGFLTLGIYTPMEIVVQCAARGSANAAGGATLQVALDRSEPIETQREILTEAVRRSHEAGKPLFVTLD